MSFNPNELRDEHGRWTDGGGTAWTALGAGRFTAKGMPMVELSAQDKHFSDYEKERALAVEVGKYAAKLGFDPEMVTVTDRSYTFDVNGETGVHAAGTANRDDGRVTIYAPQVPSQSSWTPGLMAHEIMHQKFNAFVRDYQEEYARMQKDPDYYKDGEWRTEANGDRWFDRKAEFMHPDGKLSEPYASKYPLYMLYTDVMVGNHELSKTDGVTEYSKNWWTDVMNGKAGADKGIHETLAEMAMIKLNSESRTPDHKAFLKDYAARGGKWTDQEEKDWRLNSNAGYRHYHLGEVEGKKVYFATLKGSPTRVAHVWSALYDAVDSHWDSRHKYKKAKA